jgi:tetratricopeptide (TPR) repeat protein
MAGATQIQTRIAITFVALLLGTDIAIAQTDPLPPVPAEPETSPIPTSQPPLLEQQRNEVRRIAQEEIRNSREIGDRIESEVKDTFGWTISLINFLTTVLIAIPIVTGGIAWALRRGVAAQLLIETKKQFQEETEREVREQLRIQVTADLQKQVEEFKQELEKLKTDFIYQLQNLSSDAQNEKERIFRELSRITPSIIKQEFVAPEIQQRIEELTKQLESLHLSGFQPFLTASDYLKQGDALYFEYRYEESIESYKKALEIDPEMVEAWLGISKPLRKLKRYEEAIAANDRAIQIQPSNPWGWFGKGYALTDLQKHEEAISAYEKAIQIKPDKHYFWRNKGYALTKLARYEEAIFSLEKSLNISPNSSGTFYWKAYYYVVQNQPELAIENLEKAIKLNANYQEIIRTDPDFDLIREDEHFKQLIGE